MFSFGKTKQEYQNRENSNERTTNYSCVKTLSQVIYVSKLIVTIEFAGEELK